MHILLTRPVEDSRDMILRFQSLGHKVFHIPLIDIESKNYETNVGNNSVGRIIPTSKLFEKSGAGNKRNPPINPKIIEK